MSDDTLLTTKTASTVVTDFENRIQELENKVNYLEESAVDFVKVDGQILNKITALERWREDHAKVRGNTVRDFETRLRQLEKQIADLSTQNQINVKNISDLKLQINPHKFTPKHTEQGRNKIIQIAKEKLGCLAYDDTYDVNFITLFFPSDMLLMFGNVEQFCKLANARLDRIAVREGGLDLEFELL